MTCPRTMAFVGTRAVWGCASHPQPVDAESGCAVPLLPLVLWRLPVILAAWQSEVFGLPSNNSEEKRLILVQSETEVKKLLAKSPVVISVSAVLVCRWGHAALFFCRSKHKQMKNYEKSVKSPSVDCPLTPLDPLQQQSIRKACTPSQNPAKGPSGQG